MKMRKIIVGTLSALMIAGTAFTAPAFAFGLSRALNIPQSRSERLFIREKAQSLEPFAHVLFCTRTPAECASSNGSDTVEYSAENRRLLMSVNRRVNGAITPVADNGMDQGLDDWQLAPQSGDCEDFAITKRHELIRAGIPASALRLATARTAWGEGHLVLIVRTSKGDMVLDNLTDAVRNWRKTGLRIQQIQSAGNPRVWFNI